jgi:L-amino acid N-acyltransferase YncA
MAECSMYVERRHWGSGASDLLWETIVSHAEATSLEWIVSFTASTNAPARSFCERHGMEKIGVVPLTAKAPNRPSVEIRLWEVADRSKPSAQRKKSQPFPAEQGHS